MENQSSNQFPSFGNAPQPSQEPVIPPPPSGQEQVGIRTMESDVESIRQSGGEQPQSRIVDAGDSFSKPSQPNTFSFQPPFQQPNPASNTSFNQEPAPEDKKSLSSGKIIFIIIGIIIVAVAVGFGVFYLVQSLNSVPAVPAETTPVASLPTSSTTSTPESNLVATTSPIQEVTLPPAPSSFTHVSVFGSSSIESVTLTNIDLSGIRSAIASSSQAQKLVSGSIKDLVFVTGASGSSTPVESTMILGTLFPSISSSISSLIDRDITPWLYGDKSGGNKLGFVVPLKDGVTGDQIKTALSALESNPQDVLHIFIPTVKLPAAPVFKEGLIGEIMVRYLAISTANQQVFEYAPVLVNGKGYLIITSSYNQMVDVLKRLNAKTFTTTSVTSPVTPVTVSTTTATTTTTSTP